MFFFGVVNVFFFAFALLGSSYYGFYGAPSIRQGITQVLPRLLEHFPEEDVNLTPSNDDETSAVLDVNWTSSNDADFAETQVLDDAKDCFNTFGASSVTFLAGVLLFTVFFLKLLKASRQQKVSHLRLQLTSSTQNTAGIVLQDVASTVEESTFKSPEMDSNEDDVTALQGVESTVCDSFVHFMGLQIPVKVHPEEGTHVTLNVPRECHPGIIGRNGRTKKEIHWKAKVVIAMPTHRQPTSTAIFIKGELQNLQKAARLIEKILKKLQRQR